MTPVFLDGNSLGKRVHCVENDEVRVGEKGCRTFNGNLIVESVLGVGGVYDDFVVAHESVSVGISGMGLQFCRDAPTGNVVAASRLQHAKFDGGAETAERYRKKRRVLLSAQRTFKLRVASVDLDDVARNVRRRKEGESHDVIPVHMRHEYVVHPGMRRALPGQNVVSENPDAAA